MSFRWSQEVLCSPAVYQTVAILLVAASMLWGFLVTHAQAPHPVSQSLVGANTRPSTAVVVYSQPPSSAGGLLQSSLRDPDGSASDQWAWDDFTLGWTQTITEVQWRGGYDPARLGSGGPVVDFALAIYPSNPTGFEPDVAHPPLVHYQLGGNAGETAADMLGGVQTYACRYTLPVPFQAAAGTKYWVQIEALQGGTPDWGLSKATGGMGTISANLRMKASTSVLPATARSHCWGQRSTHMGFTFHSYSDNWSSLFLWKRVYGGSTEQVLLVEDTDGGDARPTDRGHVGADLHVGSAGRVAAEACRAARFFPALDQQPRGTSPHPPDSRSAEALGYPYAAAHAHPLADPGGNPRATAPGNTRAGGKRIPSRGRRAGGRYHAGIRWHRYCGAAVASGDGHTI